MKVRAIKTDAPSARAFRSAKESSSMCAAAEAATGTSDATLATVASEYSKKCTQVYR